MPYMDHMKYMYIIIMLQSTAYQTDKYLSFSDQAHKTKEQHECKYYSNIYAATVIIILIYYYIAIIIIKNYIFIWTETCYMHIQIPELFTSTLTIHRYAHTY